MKKNRTLGETGAVLRLLWCGLYCRGTENAYACLTGQKEDALRQEMGSDHDHEKDDAHEAHPEIEIEEVFLSLFQKKGYRQT